MIQREIFTSADESNDSASNRQVTKKGNPKFVFALPFMDSPNEAQAELEVRR